MMSVINGQPVDATVTNAAFISKKIDDSTGAKLGLNDQDNTLVSGSSITNAQREFNAISSFMGSIVNQAKTYLPNWGLTPPFGSQSSTIVEMIQSLLTNFSSGEQYDYRAGVVNIPNGQDFVLITFSSSFNSSYSLQFTVENLSDTDPNFLIGYIKTKSATQFRINFNAVTDSSNYNLHYLAKREK